MKKIFILSAAFFLTSTSSIAAVNTQNYAIAYQIIENGKPVSTQYVSQVMDSEPYQFSSMTEAHYLKGFKNTVLPNKSKKIETIIDSYKTGVAISLMPHKINGNLFVDTKFEKSNLVRVDKLDNNAINPVIQTTKINEEFKVKPNEVTTLPLRNNDLVLQIEVTPTN